MRKLSYDQYLAFQVEKELIRLHPNAQYIRVDPFEDGLSASVEQDGLLVDVSAEMTAYINKLLSAEATDAIQLTDSLGVKSQDR